MSTISKFRCSVDILSRLKVIGPTLMDLWKYLHKFGDKFLNANIANISQKKLCNLYCPILNSRISLLHDIYVLNSNISNAYIKTFAELSLSIIGKEKISFHLIAISILNFKCFVITSLTFKKICSLKNFMKSDDDFIYLIN